MPAPDFITIVSGLPRSGTSLMMQMLEAGGIPLLTDGVAGHYEFAPVHRTRHDCSWVQQAPGKAVKVIYALLRHLPAGFQYRLVLMRRDPDEVPFSHTVMLRRIGTPGVAPLPDRMANAFAADLAGVLAEIARRPEFQLLEVDFRACLQDPAGVAARLNSFLGGTLDAEIAARIPDPGLDRR